MTYEQTREWKDAARFWRNVNVRRSDSLCWEWEGATTTSGYGHMHYKGRLELAHRIAWELSNGSIDGGLHVCHTCDNRVCCNPFHLWLGTAADNNKDRDDKGRWNNGWTKEGGSSHRKRLTPDQVREIRRLAIGGDLPIASIALQFGLSRSHTSSIICGRTWKDIK